VFSVSDTIVAIATPAGRGGIGVVRLSGPDACAIASRILTRRTPLAPRYATLTRTCVSAVDGSAVEDDVVVTFFPGPNSYTGDDVVEISAHGSPVILRAIVHGASASGARAARPGEFTLRAFLNRRIDLAQAEAVADLIDAATPLQARTAFDQLQGTLTRRIASIDEELFDVTARLEASLDFPDEGYHFVGPGEVAERLAAIRASIDGFLVDARRGRAVREGATVVIAGRPNTGKSSIFNKLLCVDRAIVADSPGTTRDLITETLDIKGLPITLVDTAGDRDAVDVVEREGVQRGASARAVADLLVLVMDGSEPLTSDDRRLLDATSGMARVVVANKDDRPAAFEACEIGALRLSCVTGTGVEALRDSIVRQLTGREPLTEPPALSNARHIALLETAREHLTRAIDASASATPEEFVAADLALARGCFDEVVGTRSDEDVLRHIFERFCIGK
jgi:tRNA modification GTPase